MNNPNAASHNPPNLSLKSSSQKQFSERTSKLLNDLQLPQQQSKCIQDAYERADQQLREKIFLKDIKDNIFQFCQDKYMHYIIQGILEKGTLEHQTYICRQVVENLGCLCQKKYAYKIIQSCLLNQQHLKEANVIIKYVLDNIKKLQFHQYGNLIIGTMLDIIKNDQLLALLINHLQLDTLKSHQYGCVILIKIVTIKNCNLIDQISEKLVSESVKLSTAQYSNYIVQKMLTERSIASNKTLIDEYLIPNFIELACNKFGSNVCEIMLDKSLAYQLQNLWNYVIKHHFIVLLNDEFANYVMQTYYFYIQMFNYVVESFQSQLFDLNRKQKLNQNGKIVYRYVMQCNQMVQQCLPQIVQRY